MMKMQKLFQFIKVNRKVALGILFVSAFIANALICPLYLNISIDVIRHDASKIYMAPNMQNWFGTDSYGRDVFSRIIWGSRTSLYLGISSVLLGMLLGVPFGMLSGYWGGWRDGLMMRINDTFLSFPALLFALIIIATLGSNVTNTIIAIGITFFPRISRVMRSCTISIKNAQFVKAARIRGESNFYIVFREILPNALGPMIVEGGIRISYAIVIGASLSFLGLGTQPPTPDWGLMIYEARQQVFMAPWTLIFPSIALVLLIISFNVLGDGLMDFIENKETGKNG